MQFEWSNFIGGDAVTFLHAIPEVMKLVEADEDEILAAQLIIKAIELIGKGKGHASLGSIEMTPGADEPRGRIPDFARSRRPIADLCSRSSIKSSSMKTPRAILTQVDVAGVAFTHVEKDVELFWGSTDGRFLFASSGGRGERTD